MGEIRSVDREQSVTLSEADRLTMAGLVLFGPRWKAPLARTLGVSRETVSRWTSSGDIPKWASNTVALLSQAKGAVLSLCDRTGNMVQPWAEAGFECFTVDNLPPSVDRSELRSVTPHGFARAVFEANAGRVNRLAPVSET